MGLFPLTLALLLATGYSGPVFGPSDDEDEELLAAPPLLGRPTPGGVTLSVVAGEAEVEVALTVDGEEEPREVQRIEPLEVGRFRLEELTPGTEHRYELRVKGDGRSESHAGRFVTARPPGEAFGFAVFSDPHLPVPASEWVRSPERYRDEVLGFLRFRADVGSTFRRVMRSIHGEEPDFVVCLGDMLHLTHEFNGYFPDDATARGAYLDLRRHLGQATAEAPFFAVVGNWEGENGWHPPGALDRARRARTKYLLNPAPDTYPQGGGDHEDWYAWEWGDALLCVLNVMSYTPLPHTMHPMDPGKPTDWTLGKAQLAWLERTLAGSERPFKLIFIHHVVGGNGGDRENSVYGRGGGRAAEVGEQARVHALMREHGVQVFFYGHDHVFTDIVVDGIHYTLPGSAGAPWKFPAEETGYADYDERSGYATVRVDSEGLVVEFRDERGRSFRSFTVAPGRENDDR